MTRFLHPFFILFLIGHVAVHASELPGTWSNGKDEFGTISLMLRADGQAVFATAVMPAYARWKKSETGLDLTIAGEGKSLTVPLTYDAAAKTLTGTQGKTQLILRKVSDQEPPDMLARAKAKQMEERARWEKHARMEERTAADVAAIRALVIPWLSLPADQPHAETIFIRPGGKLPTFTLRRLGPEKLFIDIPLETRSIAVPSGYPVTGKPAPAGTLSSLPLHFELPAPIQARIQALATKPGVAIETHAFEQVSVFEIESYYRKMQLILTAGDPGTPAVIDEIMAILWPVAPVNIPVTLHHRLLAD